MFSNKLKRPALAFAVTAGLLAVAGPASAQGGDRVGATSLKYETEVTDYVRFSTTYEPSPRAAIGTIPELMEFMDYTDDAAVDKDLYQPDMGIREQPTHSMPDVDDEVLARVNYEIDVFW